MLMWLWRSKVRALVLRGKCFVFAMFLFFNYFSTKTLWKTKLSKMKKINNNWMQKFRISKNKWKQKIVHQIIWVGTSYRRMCKWMEGKRMGRLYLVNRVMILYSRHHPWEIVCVIIVRFKWNHTNKCFLNFLTNLV